jgi:hypothetical protein
MKNGIGKADVLIKGDLFSNRYLIYLKIQRLRKLNIETIYKHLKFSNRNWRFFLVNPLEFMRNSTYNPFRNPFSIFVLLNIHTFSSRTKLLSVVGGLLADSNRILNRYFKCQIQFLLASNLYWELKCDLCDSK